MGPDPRSVVGRPEIQAFTGSLVGLGASKGVFVTTSTFSAQAVEFASRIPQRVVLIDGRRLTDLMVEHGVGVRSSRVLDGFFLGGLTSFLMTEQDRRCHDNRR